MNKDEIIKELRMVQQTLSTVVLSAIEAQKIIGCINMLEESIKKVENATK